MTRNLMLLIVSVLMYTVPVVLHDHKSDASDRRCFVSVYFTLGVCYHQDQDCGLLPDLSQATNEFHQDSGAVKCFL